jgi:ABC-type sugar transport system permease subunit
MRREAQLSTQTSGQTAPQRVSLMQRIWYHRTAYLFVLPAILVVLFVRLLPTLEAIRLSLYDAPMGRPARFVGLANYQRLFTESQFYLNLRITAFFTLSVVVLSLLAGLLLALLLRRAFVGFDLLRTGLFLPYVVMPVVVAMMWRWMADPVRGILNFGLNLLGFESIAFLSRPLPALILLVIVATWNLYPFPMIMFLAGLSTIPEHLYQAARVDGIGRLRQFFEITLPLLKPTLFITTTTVTLFALYAVELPLALTQGGPASSTEVLGIRLYVEAFEYFNRGFASAIGVVILVINVLLVLLFGQLFTAKWNR